MDLVVLETVSLDPSTSHQPDIGEYAREITHSQYFPMTGSNACPPVHFCKTGKTSEEGDPGSTPALETTRASQVMIWSTH
jgi:hypothetical protein